MANGNTTDGPTPVTPEEALELHVNYCRRATRDYELDIQKYPYYNFWG